MKSRGFTLIELLVAIALIAIVATIGIPNFQSLISSNRYVADYNEIVSHLHYARSEAIKRRADIIVSLAASGGSWNLEVADGTNVLRSASGGDGQVQVATGSGGKVTFNALGRRGSCSLDGTEEDCAVSVTASNRTGKMVIEATGRIEQL